jgi:hypothetical protein
MHLIIAHANAHSPQHLAALGAQSLPNFTALAKILSPVQRTTESPQSLTPLHEMLAAHGLDLSPQDGLVPWAAMDAARLGLASADTSAPEGWAWVTPCYLQANANHVAMGSADDSAMTPQEAQALLGAMHPFFAEDGITLQAMTAQTWLARGPVFHQLPTASLDRVRERATDPWIPRQAEARTLRRLQNEMQMLLYSHPVNDARAQRQQRPISGFWVSGTGNVPPHWSAPATEVLALNDLAAPALQYSAPDWANIWQTWDRGPMAQALQKAQSGHSVQLSLCGTSEALTLGNPALSWPQRLGRSLSALVRPNNLPGLLASL